MEREYNVGTWLTPSDEYIKDIKQTLVEKGIVKEGTPSSEISGILKNTLFFAEIMEKNPSLIYALIHTLGTNTDNGLTFFGTWLTDETLLDFVPIINKYWLNGTNNRTQFFCYCRTITKIPDELDLTNKLQGKSGENFFYQCNKLKEFITKDVLKLTSIKGMFYYCSDIETIETIDIQGVSTTNTSYIFDYCAKLKNLKLVNITNTLKIGSGTSWGHLLTLESLINTCKECIKQSSSKKLTIGTANLAKIADVYVKFTDPTQTEIAVGEKGEVEVCEADNNDAMTITEYMALKNWTLA